MSYRSPQLIKIANVCIIFSFTIVAHATVFYVYFNNPNSSDANPSTKIKPWKTIQKAAFTLPTGVTVYNKTETYNESVRVAYSGIVNNYITFSSYPRDELQVIITRIFLIKGKNYIKVIGLRRNLEDVGISVEGPGSDVILDGNYTYCTKSSSIRTCRVHWKTTTGNNKNIEDITLIIFSKKPVMAVGRNVLRKKVTTLVNQKISVGLYKTV